MFVGAQSIRGCPLTYGFLVLSFIIAVFSFVSQLHSFCTLSYLIFRSILGWPTLTESVLFPFAIWSFRHVERLLGQTALCIFFAHNLIVYLIAYIPLVIYAEWYPNLAFLYFYPYSLFIFIFAQLPSFSIFLILSDKLIITFLFFFFLVVQFPYSLVPFTSAIIGNVLWFFDPFNFRESGLPEIGDEEGVPIAVYRRSRRTFVGTARNGRVLAEICQMGFSRQEAVEALQLSRNDVQRAVEYLLTQ
jgi:hypothetical protein